jgi:hypothetical protein
MPQSQEMSGRGPEKTWEKSVPPQIILNSIFAALSGVLIALAISNSVPPDLKTLAGLLLALLSFLLFAMSAEGTTNAYDEKDVRKYVYYLLLYNVGVVCVGFAIAILVADHFLRLFPNLSRSERNHRFCTVFSRIWLPTKELDL